MHDIRNALQKKIQRLPVKYFDDHAFGDILSSVTNDVDTLSNALQQTPVSYTHLDVYKRQ